MSTANGVPTTVHDDAALLAWLREEAARPFAGWDFSAIAGRIATAPLPWDYRQLVTQSLGGRRAMLDMDTGGGEFLARLAPLPPRTCATEGYPPNVALARARLGPLGVAVHEVARGQALPLETGSIDLACNRHGSFDPQELWRVISPGGTFITQQVGSDNDIALNAALHAPRPAPDAARWDLATAAAQLRASGFRIELANEAFPVMRFADVGALVYHLGAIPWQVPDFSVERYATALCALHQRQAAGQAIESRNHRFVIVAEKPQDAKD